MGMVGALGNLIKPDALTKCNGMREKMTDQSEIKGNLETESPQCARCSKDPRDVKRFKTLKGQLKRESRRAHRAYLEDVSDDLHTNLIRI